MGIIAEHIHQDAPTFGIEVEFCSHDSEILSFTHIEVCTLKDGDHEWKIETDADYTLELVSPILVFDNHKEANEFKYELMEKLDMIVRKNPKLSECLKNIKDYIEKKSDNFNYYVASKKPKAPSELEIQYIKQNNLIGELDYHNWDSDTNLKLVIGKKEWLQCLKDEEIKTLLSDVLLRPSEKHGGLPSSQLNLPMSLTAYVWYSAHVKEPKAWYRLARSANDKFQEVWVTKKKESVEKIYKHLNLNNPEYTIWKKSYLSNDYLDEQRDENVPIWHRYWFWLVTIREMTELALGGSYKESHEWRQTLTNVKNGVLGIPLVHPLPPLTAEIWEGGVTDSSFEEIWTLYKDDEWGSKDIRNTDLKVFVEGGEVYSLLYIMVHKLIAGALGELSETGQLELQKIIMDMKAELSPETAESCVVNAPSLKFHYALKDLTPLWFKGTLADVLTNLKKSDSEALINGLNGLLAKDNVAEILTKNMKFLGRLYTLNTYFHYDNNYEWGSFREDLLPDVGGFVRQFEKGAKDLLAQLKQFIEGKPNSLQPFKDHPANSNRKGSNRKGFLERKDVPSWEGRWDTMKPPIKIKNKDEFLVEHRNN